MIKYCNPLDFIKDSPGTSLLPIVEETPLESWEVCCEYRLAGLRRRSGVKGSPLVGESTNLLFVTRQRRNPVVLLLKPNLPETVSRDVSVTPGRLFLAPYRRQSYTDEKPWRRPDGRAPPLEKFTPSLTQLTWSTSGDSRPMTTLRSGRKCPGETHPVSEWTRTRR